MLGVPLEAKASPAGVFEGLASVWGEVDAYGDLVEPGAFARSLREHSEAATSPLLLWSHDTARPIGRWTEIRER